MCSGDHLCFNSTISNTKIIDISGPYGLSGGTINTDSLEDEAVTIQMHGNFAGVNATVNCDLNVAVQSVAKQMVVTLALLCHIVSIPIQSVSA